MTTSRSFEHAEVGRLAAVTHAVARRPRRPVGASVALALLTVVVGAPALVMLFLLAVFSAAACFSECAEPSANWMIAAPATLAVLLVTVAPLAVGLTYWTGSRRRVPYGMVAVLLAADAVCVAVWLL